MLRSILMTIVMLLTVGMLVMAAACSNTTGPSRSSCSRHSHCPSSYCASDGYCSVG